MRLDAVVSSYILNFRSSARAEMRYFQAQPSLSAAIEKAALCVTPKGKRHPHQRRIPKAVLEKAKERLQAAARNLKVSTDFAALHRIVECEIRSIRGIGPLTVYDMAHRLGAFLGKAPHFVYLHSGTRTGAASLGLKGVAIAPFQLPAAFSRLTPAEIEDCLCIYKDQLLKGNATPIFEGSRSCRTMPLRGKRGGRVTCGAPSTICFSR